MSEYIDINGTQIAYTVSGGPDTGGEAPWAVILQGWGTNYRLYDSIAQLIGDRYRVLQFDLPGFGASAEPPEAWSVDQYTDFFIEFLSALGITSCMLIGHSFGGRIIIKLAARESCPLDITRIILVDSAGVLPLRTPAQKRKQFTYKLLKKFFANKFIYFLFPEIIDDWKSRQGSEDYRRATPLMKGVLVKSVNEDLTDCLHKISRETLLIWGDQDTATPMRDAHIMEREIPNCGLAVIPGTGHFSYAEDPAMFARIVNSFI